jgi:hypothetical protein
MRMMQTLFGPTRETLSARIDIGGTRDVVTCRRPSGTRLRISSEWPSRQGLPGESRKLIA